jgi:hypothetical protein
MSMFMFVALVNAVFFGSLAIVGMAKLLSTVRPHPLWLLRAGGITVGSRR